MSLEFFVLLNLSVHTQKMQKKKTRFFCRINTYLPVSFFSIPLVSMAVPSRQDFKWNLLSERHARLERKSGVNAFLRRVKDKQSKQGWVTPPVRARAHLKAFNTGLTSLLLSCCHNRLHLCRSRCLHAC